MTGWKTYFAAIMLALGGVIAQTDWISFFANPKAGAVAIGSALLMAVMRKLTNGPPAV
jgi:hypothetical protein